MSSEQLIWDYLDGNLASEDRKVFEERLSQDQVFRERFEEHVLIHELLKKNILAEPSANFTQKVIGKLEKDTPPSFSLNGILLFLIAFIVVNLLILFSSSNTTEGGYEIFNTMNILAQNVLTQKIGMILLGVSGLILLDQVLGKRMNQRNKIS